MTDILIAMSSEDLCHVLQGLLQCKFSVTCCQDGKTALKILEELRPEVMILDLSLRELDGISLLEQAKEFRPPVILATIDYNCPYVLDVADDVGIGYIIMLPGDMNALITRLLDLYSRHHILKAKRKTAETRVAQLLLELDFPTHLDGYLYLQAAIPLYVTDKSQRVCKELYPTVRQLLGVQGKDSVEHSIRSAIDGAWARRKSGVWEKYFGHRTKSPSNKQLISRLAEEILQDKTSG